jgi:hypothetical protein
MHVQQLKGCAVCLCLCFIISYLIRAFHCHYKRGVMGMIFLP